MKSLNEYVLESKLEENILNRIYFHTCVEFKLNNSLYPYIVESLGKFDNAGKVVKHIIDTLKTNFESQIIDCTNDNVYFKYINIELNAGENGYGTYLKFKDNTIYLEIGAKSKDYLIENIDRYTETIIHELLHGFEDYNRIKKYWPRNICLFK